MDLDEGDDAKIRRNLVVFSGLIVLLAWLQVPVTELLASFFKTETVTQLSPLRVWIACALCLGYFTHRYCYTSDFSTSVAQFRGTYFRKMRNNLDALLTRYAVAYARDRKRKCSYFDSLPAEETLHFDNRAGRRSLSSNDDNVHLEFSGIRSNPENLWMGFLDFKYLYVSENLRVELNGRAVRYKLSGIVRLKVAMPAYLYPLASSRYTTQLVIPCLVTAAAYAVVLYRLFHAM